MSLTNPKIKGMIEENALALATVDQDNKPHCIAVAFARVVSENQILITDNYMVKTRYNIQDNPNVSVVVWNKNWKENCTGYELKGRAEYFESGKWLEKAKEISENKGEPRKGALLITVSEIKKLS